MAFIPKSIEDAAYPQSGGFGPFGQSQPRTLGQLEQDTIAKQLLEASYQPSFDAIEREEARRGDPMQEGIEGAIKKLQYERLQPAGAQSSIAASYAGGGGNVDSDVIGQRQMGGPTIEDAIQQQQAERLAGIKAFGDVGEQARGAMDSQRLGLIQELAETEAKIAQSALPDDVKRQRVQEARRRVQAYVEMLKSGFPPRDPFGLDNEADTDTSTSRPSPKPSPGY